MSKAAAAPMRFGSDFSGMDTAVVALKRMKVKVSVEFCSDNDTKCQNLLQAVHKPKKLFVDAVRDAANQPKVDIYVNTPPCQAFASCGKGKALKDKRGRLLKTGVKYAALRRPKIWIMGERAHHCKNGRNSSTSRMG